MARAKRRQQVAALAYRITADAHPEVILVTSRETRRWVLPKGWPMKGRGLRKAAAIEAFEEAGIVGKTLKSPVGTYDYDKRINDRVIPCRVSVYALPVEKLEDHWLEMAERERAWHTMEEAAELVDEPGLSAILRAFQPKRRETLISQTVGVVVTCPARRLAPD